MGDYLNPGNTDYGNIKNRILFLVEGRCLGVCLTNINGMVHDQALCKDHSAFIGVLDFRERKPTAVDQFPQHLA